MKNYQIVVRGVVTIKSKAVVISQDFYPKIGGIARYLESFIEKYLSDFEVHVITPREICDGVDYSNKDYYIHSTDFSPFDFNNIQRRNSNEKITQILSNIDPCCIFLGYVRSHPEALLDYRKNNTLVKLFAISHAKEIFFNIANPTNVNGSQRGFLSEEIYFYKQVLNQFDFLMPVSKYTQLILYQNGVNKPKTVVVNPPVNPPHYVQTTRNMNTFNILSVGRLIKRKGQDEVLKSLPRVIEKHPQVRYSIIGSGPEYRNLCKLIKELDLESSVNILYDVADSELASHYQSSDLFVLPTKHLDHIDVEGFGIVFLEAGSYGIPSIGGRTGGVVDAIEDNKTGFLINPYDSCELSDKICELISNDTLRKKMGNEAYHKAKPLFTCYKSELINSLLMVDK
jgi:phosphatidylinositol alpha-1,6-mannosyltransferase